MYLEPAWFVILRLSIQYIYTIYVCFLCTAIYVCYCPLIYRLLIIAESIMFSSFIFH